MNIKVILPWKSRGDSTGYVRRCVLTGCAQLNIDASRLGFEPLLMDRAFKTAKEAMDAYDAYIASTPGYQDIYLL